MNTPRPASFDARVMAYLPGLQKLAVRYHPTNAEARTDLVTDTIISALSNWQSFREDGGFYTWLTWQMRGVVSAEREAAVRAKRRGITVAFEDWHAPSMDGGQEAGADLGRAVRALAGIRRGDVLLRYAAASVLTEIAAIEGVTSSRVQQLVHSLRAEIAGAA